MVKGKVLPSHYRVLGLELIPVYRQSAIFINHVLVEG